MSVQAMSWALSQRDLKDSSARHVLLCLANYAGTDGRGAFPSATTLSADTGLSERTVRYKLDDLEKGGFIVRGNQAIAAVHIDRHDRLPVVYDLPIQRGAESAPRSKRGANDVTGCNQQQNGVQISTERGAVAAPNPSLNHQITEEQQLPANSVEEVIDENQRFAMFPEWTPTARHLKTQLTLMAFPVGHQIPDEVFRSFLAYHCARPAVFDSQGGWANRLATWAKRERVAGAGEPVGDDDDTSWLNGSAQL